MRRAVALAALVAALFALALPAATGAAQPTVPKRIVALTPFAANTLAKLGVMPIGVGQTLGGETRLSPKLKNVTVLPLSHPNGPNLEQLASLRPDLVLSSRTWVKGNQAMENLGIDVVVHEPITISRAYADTYKIGMLVGKKRQARNLLKAMQKSVAAATKGIASHPKVMLILGVGRTPFTMLPNSWGGDIVAKAGGELLTGGVSSDSGFERISDEVVVAENPDVIIAVPHANADDIPSLRDYLRANPAWSSTTAAQAGRVYVSVDNSLLQAGTDIARTIRKVRSVYLKN
ncbi:MAG: iron complex transport system substrate-binding protein [Solirubrobacterales bacterium]|nr:iron complex transport system substrate-binding protein [Solirubrobacterales bacterium]